jgi:hypothetical protein
MRDQMMVRRLMDGGTAIQAAVSALIGYAPKDTLVCFCETANQVQKSEII